MMSGQKMDQQAALGVGSWAIIATLDSFTVKKLKKVVSAHHLYIGKFVGGKLKQGIMYQNAMEVGLQLGLVPKPARKAPKNGM